MGHIEKKIRVFLADNGWLHEIQKVNFLAAGEYNENYAVQADSGRYVFRINHGSQLNLTNQIEYEFHVLKAVEPSGVTPKAHRYQSDCSALGGGVLLMEFLEGKPLDYHEDRKKAASIFSRIHTVPPYYRHLIYQTNPVADIAEESLGLIRRFADHPLKKERGILLYYAEEMHALAERTKKSFLNESLCIVNTEVNSGNFIVQRDQAFLLDWEKAVVSYRYQDLGHFLVSTTTLWKSDVVFTEEQKREFLAHYCALLRLDLSFEEVWEKTKILEKTILLRALSWCFMAYYEYTKSERTLRNENTFQRIRDYMNNMDNLLKGGGLR